MPDTAAPAAHMTPNIQEPSGKRVNRLSTIQWAYSINAVLNIACVLAQAAYRLTCGAHCTEHVELTACRHQCITTRRTWTFKGVLLTSSRLSPA